MREADVEEEGLLRLGLALDEVDRRLGDVALDLPAVVHGVGPRPSSECRSRRIPRCRARPRRWPPRACRRAACSSRYRVPSVRLEDADVVLVEALARRPALLARAEVPLAGDAGGVALALEQLAERHFAGLKRVRRAADDDGAETQPLRIAPGHQRRARRRAGRLHQVLRQPQALARRSSRCAASACRGPRPRRRRRCRRSRRCRPA